MNPKLKKTIIVLHISAILYFLSGMGFLAMFIFMHKISFLVLLVPIICTQFSIFIEAVVHGLKNNQRWAWIAAMAMCGLYLLSAFIVLGIIGLIGLTDEGVVKEFLKK